MATPWHEEAIKLRKEGVGPTEIARKVNAKFNIDITPSRVSQVTSPTPEKYQWSARQKDMQEKKKPDTRALAREQVKKEEKEMSDRVFEKVSPTNSTDLRPGVRIRCGADGCNATMVWKKHGTIHPVHAAKVFRNAGWIVGGGPRADRCPEHKAGLGHAKPAPEPEKKEPVKDFKELANAMVAKREEETKQAVTVEAPHPLVADETGQPNGDHPAVDEREMTRTDRRVIIAKLEDVYLDEQTGYKGDWNDAKVATDLGVPLVWVETLREENFGPAKNAALVAKQMEELLAFGAKISATAAGINSAVTEIDARIKEYDALVEGFDEDFKRFNELYTELKK